MPGTELCTSSSYIGLMFRRRVPDLDTDYLIQKLTGDEFLHVDILFVPALASEDTPLGVGVPPHERNDSMRCVFTTFVKDTFRVRIPKEWGSRTDESHLLTLLPVSEEEFSRSRRYVADLCAANVPYNYLDLMLCAIPKWCSRRFAHDPPPYPIPSTVFCSQAALLMLRQALPRDGGGGLMHTLNSRACRPQNLYEITRGAFHRVDVGAFVTRGGMVARQ